MVDSRKFQRGDIWIGDTGGSFGRRPYVIVSNNRFNATSDYLTVCPLTSRRKKDMESHVIIEADDNVRTIYSESTIMTEQIQTIRKECMHSYVMSLSREEMRRLNMAIIYTIGSI